MEQKVLRAHLLGCGADAEAQLYRAQTYILMLPDVSQWMADVPKELDEKEREIKDVPDYPSRVHQSLKLYMLRCVEFARAMHKESDPLQTRFFIAKIKNDLASLIHNKERIISINNGKNNGKLSSHKGWADALANYLNAKYPKAIKERGWTMIPLSYDPRLKIETDESDYDIYRDDINLIAINIASGEQSQLKKSSFFKNYYKTRK